MQIAGRSMAIGSIPLAAVSGFFSVCIDCESGSVDSSIQKYSVSLTPIIGLGELVPAIVLLSRAKRHHGKAIRGSIEDFGELRILGKQSIWTGTSLIAAGLGLTAAVLTATDIYSADGKRLRFGSAIVGSHLVYYGGTTLYAGLRSFTHERRKLRAISNFVSPTLSIHELHVYIGISAKI